MTLRFTASALALLLTSSHAAHSAKIELSRYYTSIAFVSTGQNDPKARLFAKLVTSAFKSLDTGNKPVKISLTWVDDRHLQLDPLLSRKVFDMGIAWRKPDCSNQNLSDLDARLCKDFFFSKPLFSDELRYFVNKPHEVSNPQTGEFTGKRVCVGGEHQVAPSGKLQVTRSASLRACFLLLQSGLTDAVIAGQKEGLNAASGISVKMLARPFSVTTYHAVIAKSHMRARTYLYYFNAAISAFKTSQQYQQLTAGRAVLAETKQ